MLEGFDEHVRAYINDPAQGPRLVSRAELDESYSGVVLTFSPGPGFTRGGTPPDIVSALARRLEGNHEALRYVLLCGLCLVVPGLVVPSFTRIFVDDYLIGGQGWLIRPLLLAMIIAAMFQGVLTWLQQYFLLRLETKVALSTSSRFFNHILRLPAAYFGQRFAGEIGSRVQINDRVAKVISGKLATTIIDSVMTVFYAGLMLLYDVPMTLAVIAIASLNVGAIVLAARSRIDISSRLVQDKGKLMGTAMGGLQMVETLKATGAEDEFFARYAGYHARAMNTEQELNVLSQWAAAVPPLTQTLATAAVLLLGGLRVMDGQLTVGMLVAYQTLLVSFMRPLTNFVQFGSMIQELNADMNRLDDVLRYPQAPEYAVPAGVVGHRSGHHQAHRARRAARRDVRLQPARAAADQELQSHGGAGAARGDRRRERQRQEHRRQARRRSLRAVGRTDSLRRRAPARSCRATCSRTPSAASIRTFSSSPARSARTSRCGTRRWGCSA